MPVEREVAGLRCGEVLAELSGFLDGDLDALRRSQLEAHLQGCDACTRFGADFATAVGALKQVRAEGDAAVFQRLQLALSRARG